MIYVTHNLTEVLTLADWVLMIQQGKLIAQGVPKDTLRSVRALQEIAAQQIENVFTAILLGSDPAARRQPGPNRNGCRVDNSMGFPGGKIADTSAHRRR